MRKKKQAKIPEKLQFYSDEVFKEISLGEDDDRLQLRYAISNYGRLVSFRFWHELEYGRIVKGTKQDGYRIWNYSVRDDKNKLKYRHRFYYRLVAEYFHPKTSEEQVYVLHLDRKRDNDRIDNLKWATKAEQLEHSKKSPYVQSALKKQVYLLKKYREQGITGKLTSTQVIRLKKKLLDPNRKTRLKMLAKQFGVTEMQLYRIKSGENWGHIKV
jgi:hypothetical protein